MRFRAAGLRFLACAAMLALLCAFLPDPSHEIASDFIVTAAPVYEPLAALRVRERFPKGAQLLLVHEGKAEPLVSGFAATADANVSFDGMRVLFAGKKTATDPWRVWELTLATRAIRQLTTGTGEAIRPLYLPSDRFVFAERKPQGFQLQSAPITEAPANSSDLPGDEAVIPLTFTSGNAIPSDVLADGRILFESGFPLGSGAIPELFLVYADGSGVESYRCDHGSARWGGKQLASGDIVFTHGACLARFSSPLAHEEHVVAPRAEFAGAIAETPSGAWLLSARDAKSAHYAIVLWKPGARALEPVLATRGEDLVEPVLVGQRMTPKRHPSALHPWDYANLLALDARVSRDGTLAAVPAAVWVEMQGANGRAIGLGTAPVEQDGSFFVKIRGDRPIRLALLDAKGTVLRQEHGWFWARAGEQRYCVGCHAGPERAPQNRVPAVLLRSTMPVDLTTPTLAGAAQSAAQGGR